MGKRSIPGGGKVVLPGELKNLAGKPGGDLPGTVRGAGVHHNNLIYQASNTFQTPCQHILLIFYDHA